MGKTRSEMTDSDVSIKEKIAGAKSYHDAISRIMPHAHGHPAGAGPGHRAGCHPKPRPFHGDPEFETAGRAHNFMDERARDQPPKVHGRKGGLDPSAFKSRAVYCEVKLAEMLGKGGPRARPTTPGKYEDAPDAYRASVCCLLLGEICGMDTPYSRVLRTILQVLEQCIYSNYVTPHDGGAFDQIPYFDLVRKLEHQHEEMVEEQDRWKITVQGHQAAAYRIHLHIEELNGQMTAEKSKSAELQKDLLMAQRALRKATKEVKVLSQKLNQGRAQILQARELRLKYEDEVDKNVNLHARYMDLTKELQRCQANLGVARQEAADGVPKEEFRQAEHMIYDLQTKLQKADRFVRQSGALTPRPEWAQIRGGPLQGLPTAMQAAQVCELNKKLNAANNRLQAECAAAQVALAEAKQHVAAPEAEKKAKSAGKKSPKK